jgi:outer membrane receptor protein involved in Fe transport
MKKLLLILLINTAHAVELGLTAGTLGAGVEVGYKYHDFEIDGIYNNSTINYQNVDTNFRGYELLLKYYINNNFYLVGGYINETIDN